MGRRSVLVGLAAAAGAAAVLRRRTGPASAAHVDLFLDDGSLVSLPRGDEQARRMLSVAGRAIAAVRASA